MSLRSVFSIAVCALMLLTSGCATRVASLVWEPCTGFETLRPDATPSQRAYADYLRGQVAASDIPLLPELQRTAALRAPNDGSALPSAAEPLSILVASGVLLQTGKASPAVIEQAVNVASQDHAKAKAC